MITPCTTKPHQHYHVKGKRVPGASSIAKQCQDCQSLMDWATQLAYDNQDPVLVGQYEARIGTIAHSLFQSYVTGEDIDLKHCAANDIVLARKAADKAVSWWNREGLALVAAEHKLECSLGYGGTLDLVGSRFVGDPKVEEFVLLDWKRTNGIWRTHLIQVAGLAYAWNEANPGQQVTERYVIRLCKEGDTEIVERRIGNNENELLRKLFLNQLDNYQLNKLLDKLQGK